MWRLRGGLWRQQPPGSQTCCVWVKGPLSASVVPHEGAVRTGKMAQEAGSCIGPKGALGCQPLPSDTGGPGLFLLSPLSFLEWVAQRTSRYPLQGLSIQSLLFLVELYHRPYKSSRAPFPVPLPFLAVLALSWALCSTCFLPPQQCLPFVGPAASAVMWCVSLTADICLVCCGPSAGHCCPLEPSYCFTAGLHTRSLYLRFSIAAAFWYGAGIWNFLFTIWIW